MDGIWKQQLTTDSYGNPVRSISNLRLIFTSDENLRLIKYDTFCQDDVCFSPLFRNVNGNKVDEESAGKIQDYKNQLAELNEQGYVLTDRNQKTTADGLYAAGDVCVKPLRQVVTAVGDGALAATELERLCAAMQAKTSLHPQRPVSRAEETAAPAEAGSTLFTGDMLSQLHTVFARMASPLILRLFLDETPLSAELRQYMEELAAQSSKLSVELGDPAETDHLPCVRVCHADGSWTGLSFHGVPGGHEFTSFVLGLYNAAGPGQALDEESRAAIQSIQKPVDFQVLVSLSCTMCPELVTAAQRLAAENPNITAQVYDLNHFPDLRERYQVMSVPCLVVNGGEQVSFGKKNVRQLLELLNL